MGYGQESNWGSADGAVEDYWPSPDPAAPTLLRQMWCNGEQEGKKRTRNDNLPDKGQVLLMCWTGHHRTHLGDFIFYKLRVYNIFFWRSCEQEKNNLGCLDAHVDDKIGRH